MSQRGRTAPMLEKFLSTRCAIEICGKIQLVLAGLAVGRRLFGERAIQSLLNQLWPPAGAAE